MNQKNRNTLENDALQQLDREGKCLKAGQILKYITTNYHGKSKRTLPIEMIYQTITKYDAKRYTELLGDVIQLQSLLVIYSQQRNKKWIAHFLASRRKRKR